MASPPANTPAKPLERTCLVTVGATVGFKSLTQAALCPPFWQHLRSRGFTELRIQCGPDISWAAEERALAQPHLPPGLDVVVFDYRRDLLKDEMMRCKAAAGKRAPGLVMCHAGTGTILDAWRLGLCIVVVPNPELLGNHQAEMAQHLATEGYAIMSTARHQDLQEAIHKAELLWEDNKSRWPSHAVGGAGGSLRLWDIDASVGELEREKNAQMAHD